MSSKDDSEPAGCSYSHHRQINTSVTVENKVIDAEYDFIFILVIVQKLKIEYLLITWQLIGGSIGIGGTARIDQASQNVQTSLAFKRIKKKDKDKSGSIMQELISEMLVLSHSAIQRHSNIVELQGIC
jgi:hypothetical protein